MRLLMLLVGVWGLCWGGLLSLRALTYQDETAPEVAVLLPDESCFAPCWNGIQTAALGVDQIDAMLATRLEDTDSEWARLYGETYTASVIAVGLLVSPRALSIGEVVLALGVPDYLLAEEHGTTGNIAVEVVYESEQVVFVVVLPADSRLTPASPVVAIRYPFYYFTQPYYFAHRWEGWVWVRSLLE